MMKKINIKVCLLFVGLLQLAPLWGAQIEIPFKGEKVFIIGEIASLTIKGSSSNVVKVNSTETIQAKEVDFKIDGDVLKLALLGKRNVQVELPKDIFLTCHPVPVFFEGSFDPAKDYGQISIENMDNEVEFNGDGYHVNIQDINGPVSIVTYGNITGSLAKPQSNGMILLDTYLGNVDLVLPEKGKAKLECTALKGTVDVSDKLVGKYNQQQKSETSIILHSENGKYVRVRTAEEVANLKYPALRSDSKDILLHQNQPNPFKEVTNIGFDLPEKASVNISFYDIPGTVIHEIKGVYEAGFNQVKVTKTELNISGVVYYELKCGEFSASRKMIVSE